MPFAALACLQQPEASTGFACCPTALILSSQMSYCKPEGGSICKLHNAQAPYEPSGTLIGCHLEATCKLT